MEANEVLNKVGLSQKESAVYLAVLELGTADVTEIAKKAGIKRPTCYLVLDTLKDRGLVSQVPAKVNLFVAEAPEKLLGELYKKQELLKRAMPQLSSLYNITKEKPRVRLFEGREGIKEVYQKIYKVNEVSFFGTTREVQKYDPEGLWEFVKRTEIERLHVRDLLLDSPEDRRYAQKAQAGPNYEIRFLAPEAKILTDNAIFGDCVVFFSFHPQIFAVMITSHEVSQAIKALFELSWQSSTPYNTTEKKI